ncbi:MAG: ROK family protein [Chloroflexaceae bacterium]|nr:ROK family protein [Chloroflexaceae bacterium]
MNYCIGVDIGGTQVRAALVDHEGRIQAERRGPTDALHGPQPIIDQVETYVAWLRAQIPEGGRLVGIGVGCPGPLDPVAGIVFTTPNLAGWKDVPLRAILSERTGLPVELANDANAAALGEWYFGGGRGYSHMVYITVSTGIGSGVIIGGKLLLGRAGCGAELGHMMVGVPGRTSWEQLASGTALKRAAAEAMQTHPHTLLHGIATPQTVTAADVASAATCGDQVAQTLMQREAEFLGVGFVSILHLFSPEIILVGGSVVTANPWLLRQAREVVQERVIANIYREVPIEVAHLGSHVGILGAASLLMGKMQP